MRKHLYLAAVASFFAFTNSGWAALRIQPLQIEQELTTPFMTEEDPAAKKQEENASKRKELEQKIKDLDVNDPNFQKALQEYEKELEGLRAEEKKKEAEEQKKKNPRLNPRLRPLQPIEDQEIQDVEQMMQQMMKQMLELQRQGGQGLQPFAPLMGLRPAQPRLGLQLEDPSPVLAEQLNLPEDQGLVVMEVLPNTVAEKAGFKVNDVILKLNGTPVANDVQQFVRQIRETPAKQKLEFEVLRKGKKELIKDVQLPEPAKNERVIGDNPFQLMIPNLENAFRLQGASGMSIEINNDQFSIKSNRDGKTVVIKGQMVEGKKEVKTIQIQDGATTHQATKVEDLPEQYREMVKQLLSSIR